MTVSLTLMKMYNSIDNKAILHGRLCKMLKNTGKSVKACRKDGSAAYFDYMKFVVNY